MERIHLIGLFAAYIVQPLHIGTTVWKTFCLPEEFILSLLFIQEIGREWVVYEPGYGESSGDGDTAGHKEEKEKGRAEWQNWKMVAVLGYNSSSQPRNPASEGKTSILKI